ncbi:hypothetical protein MesoLj113a_73460 [Mesorhizobium sp. 113-1-2]|nr:hypothetical protein MesoLj113a_73460 [Mesorhizobium sp. 113-1-2]
MSPRNAPRPAAVYGVDIGKNIFHVVGLDSGGEPIQRARFRRDSLLQFFERAAPAIVGMESCAGSQWIARRLHALGHKVRLIPAQFVKPYVKSNKSDIIDGMVRPVLPQHHPGGPTKGGCNVPTQCAAPRGSLWSRYRQEHLSRRRPG